MLVNINMHYNRFKSSDYSYLPTKITKVFSLSNVSA